MKAKDTCENGLCVGLGHYLHCSCSSLLGSYCGCKTPWAVTLRELWKSRGSLLVGPGNYTADLVTRQDQGRQQRERGPGVLCSLRWEGAWVSRDPSLLVNLNIRRELKAQEEQKQVAQMISYWNQPRCLRHLSWRGAGVGDSRLWCVDDSVMVQAGPLTRGPWESRAEVRHLH